MYKIIDRITTLLWRLFFALMLGGVANAIQEAKRANTQAKKKTGLDLFNTLKEWAEEEY